MSTETQSTATQQQFAVRGFARLKQMPQWRRLSYFTKEVLTLKLEKTNGNLIEAIALLQPRESHEKNAALASAILSDPDVAFMEHILDTTFEEIERENAAKE